MPKPPRVRRAADTQVLDPPPLGYEQRQGENEVKESAEADKVSSTLEADESNESDGYSQMVGLAPSQRHLDRSLSVVGAPIPRWSVDEVKRPACGSMFVIRDSYIIGKIWHCVASCLILYIATVFPYKLCFLDFSPTKPEDAEDPLGWEIVEKAVAWLFIVDLFINFFFSYRDADGHEVIDLRYIALHYVCTFMFWVNFVACIPEALTSLIIMYVSGPGNQGNTGAANKAFFILRLQRIARLVRMLRLAKLANVAKFKAARKLKKLRGPRMMGLAVCLFWSMHLLGCGWFLIAVLDHDLEASWITARDIVDAEPATQWLTSMYFVLTVFTTVGFGDISPGTVLEIFYGSIVMIVGTVLNTVFLSEVISMLSMLDRRQVEIENVVSSIQDFADHTHVCEELSFELESYIRSGKSRATAAGLEMHVATKLFDGTVLPRDSLAMLAEQAFGGVLIANTIFADVTRGIYTPQVTVPRRLVLFVANMGSERAYSTGEAVYRNLEMTASLYCVMSGTFAYVKGQKTQHPYHLMGKFRYFGDYEVVNDVDTRVAATRCERDAVALIIPKKDFLSVCKDNFPGFLRALRKISWTHEAARRRHMKEGPKCHTYLDLAGKIIMREWRAWRRSHKSRHECIDTMDAAIKAPAQPVGPSRYDDIKAVLRKLNELQRTSDHNQRKLADLQNQVNATNSTIEEKFASLQSAMLSALERNRTEAVAAASR
eukprot:TRINITY_DN7150_c0_g2_i1.p1 TRINITY_DN7150_c0_g2~~TRINITY_DN7150_c0_g2_i1.p1  ORF type:complete len:715 (+),score=109.84 TRINITY_DN7150_c0_g2_i1:29-2173(+)